MYEIEKTPVNESVITQFMKEDEFIGLSFELIREVIQYALVVCNFLPKTHGAWNRNSAILCGHVVRLAKLLIGMLNHVSERQQELASIFLRLCAECIVNLTFLIEEDSEEVFESYIRYSLRHEKQLLERIQNNIGERDDDSWHIEDRIRASIMRTFDAVEVKPEEINSTDRFNWGSTSIYGRAKAVGLGTAYLGLFSGGSHIIHGNWQDLFDSHLIQREDGLFLPNTDWQYPQPQPLNAMGMLSIDAMSLYLEYIDPTILDYMEDDLQDLRARLIKADYLHEIFVQSE